MSTPEWMQKFKQIGQKGDEEVTTVGEEGIVKTVEPARVGDGAGATPSSSDPMAGGADDVKPPPSPGGTTTRITTTITTTNTNIKINKNNNNNNILGVGDDDDDDEEEEEDAAALFRMAGGSSMAESSEATPLGSDVSVDSNDAAALSYAAGGGGGGGGGGGEERMSPDPPTSSDWEPEEAEAATAMAATAAALGTAAAVGERNDGAGADEVGDSWVVDRERLLDEEMKQEYGEEVVSGRSLGDENYEDVYVDDYGNEVFVDEDGNEVQEEEILLDADGNEVGAEEGYFNDEVEAEVALAAVGDRALPATPVFEEYIPYDIEDQRKVLQTTAKGKRSYMSSLVPILAFLAVASAVLLVLFLVGLDDKDTSGLAPTMAPTPMQYLPLNPTSNGNIEAAATTRFDPYQNNCDYGSLPQPNFIDQCACTGAVDIVADDVRARRESLMETFMPSVLPLWNETVSSCTAENQALLWLSSGINNGGEISNLLRLQRYAPAFLYVAQGGTRWRQSNGWLTEIGVCEWDNVECDSNSYVQFLNLDGNRLDGQLSEAAALLNAIEGLFVAQNDLFGTIPPSYFASTSLRSIDFSSNSLTGDIPSPSGPIPLASINVESNNLSGPLPLGIVNATGLSSLNVASNSFSGIVPSGLFDLPLTELAIGDNLFNGTIPDDIQRTTTLKSLSLGPNLFTGEIPTSLGELTNLERLSIVGIQGLGGRLPASYGLTLTNLLELSISETSVSGNIPAQFAGMTDLVILHLSSNSLGRLVTPDLAQLTNLESLQLNNNAFSGTIPSQFGSLTNVSELLFHTNRFVGTIPVEFGNLAAVRTLTFDGNFMDGRAPQGVCNLRVDGQLSEFIVDCPMQVGDSTTVGIICNIPDCCTECL